jgi:hypothetical protein
MPNTRTLWELEAPAGATVLDGTALLVAIHWSDEKGESHQVLRVWSQRGTRYSFIEELITAGDVISHLSAELTQHSATASYMKTSLLSRTKVADADWGKRQHPNKVGQRGISRQMGYSKPFVTMISVLGSASGKAKIHTAARVPP